MKAGDIVRLEITPKQTVLYAENDGYYLLGSTVCALGNVIEALKEDFPADVYDVNFHVERVTKAIDAGTDIGKYIWGIHDNGESLFFFHQFVYGEDKVKLSLADVEKLRIKSNITTTFTLKSQVDKNEGFIFKVSHIREIIYALLYYYAFYDYHLVCCEHCGRWFATKSFKNKYCPRKTTFEGYTHLQCKQAVDNIKQEIQRRYHRRYNAIATYEYDSNNSAVNEFLNQYHIYKDRIKERKSIENLQACLNWLDGLKKRR